jgi:hypothetical protein
MEDEGSMQAAKASEQVEMGLGEKSDPWTRKREDEEEALRMKAARVANHPRPSVQPGIRQPGIHQHAQHENAELTRTKNHWAKYPLGLGRCVPDTPGWRQVHEPVVFTNK